jgi:hypothetical protein
MRPRTPQGGRWLAPRLPHSGRTMCAIGAFQAWQKNFLGETSFKIKHLLATQPLLA